MNDRAYMYLYAFSPGVGLGFFRVGVTGALGLQNQWGIFTKCCQFENRNLIGNSSTRNTSNATK